MLTPDLARAETAPAASAEKSTAKIKHVDAAGAAKVLAEKQVVVLDIRTPAEFKSGHLAGATNINFNSPDFARQIAALDKSKTYLVHCAVGGRSTRSLESFKQQGFQSIVHLDGGIAAWKQAGKPIEK